MEEPLALLALHLVDDHEDPLPAFVEGCTAAHLRTLLEATLRLDRWTLWNPTDFDVEVDLGHADPLPDHAVEPALAAVAEITTDPGRAVCEAVCALLLAGHGQLDVASHAIAFPVGSPGSDELASYLRRIDAKGDAAALGLPTTW